MMKRKPVQLDSAQRRAADRGAGWAFMLARICSSLTRCCSR
jgi:hypothetical protein